ncbi:hypothetical protein FACS189421_06050 [Bacteroidia bacterium]|nr:hypothetical protein FACS189421_06050 [Bacteroidia bacterium]GHT03359.1 hypothetical protein FACS189423_04060 [Bacteroidia bacterium]GHT45198.1 hypothetical protein FACS189440_00730 [Bacteroidia bacterium]
MKTNRTIPSKYKKIIVEVCRVLIGLVFIFSGFVKAVDPLGSAYKFHDYFAAMGLQWLDFSVLPAAFFLSALEFSLGLCLLAGVYRKIVSWLVLLFMCFMTPLTLYVAIANPVTDCGCFGDALVITNWQTFYKNIVLIIAAILVFLWRKQMTRLFSKKCRSLVALFTVVFILGVSLYCYAYLPVLDFRPYKIGNNISELMQIPEGAETDVYETTFIYEKEGVQQKFSMDNYPKGDTGWTFVETINTLIKKGYEPPIHDFTITTEEGDDMTGEILTDAGYTFLLIAHKLEEADDSNVDKINTLYDYARQNEYRFICLTSSLPEQITEWKESTGAEYPFCTMDDIALKTIIRSNPGLMLLHDATIVNKWAGREIPGEKDLQSPLENSSVGVPPVNQDVRNILLLALILLIPLIGLYIWDRKNRIINI